MFRLPSSYNAGKGNAALSEGTERVTVCAGYLFLCRIFFFSLRYLCFRIFFLRFFTTLAIRFHPQKIKRIQIINH